MTVMNGMRTSEKRSGHRYNDVKKSRGGGATWVHFGRDV